jgi:hypothetical protein
MKYPVWEGGHGGRGKESVQHPCRLRSLDTERREENRWTRAPVGEVGEEARVGIEGAEAAVCAAHDAHTVPDMRHAQLVVHHISRTMQIIPCTPSPLTSSTFCKQADQTKKTKPNHTHTTHWSDLPIMLH